MPNDFELTELDPNDLMDAEASRMDRTFATFTESEWRLPSRCAGWTRRDLLGHLIAVEDYFRACLDGNVAGFIAERWPRGVSHEIDANAVGVAKYAALDPTSALDRWRYANTESRARLRQRGDGEVDTFIGAYPCRLQTFHFATELAIHADDGGVQVGGDERAARTAWRAKFARFALSEKKPYLEIKSADGRTIVSDGHNSIDLTDEEFVEVVASRIDMASRPDRDVLQIIAITP